MEQIILPAKKEFLNALLDFIGVYMFNSGIDKLHQNKILIAAEEIFVNIANYAYSSGNGNVTVSAWVESEQIFLEFRDSGKPFNPVNQDIPELFISAEAKEIGGLGIHMVKNMMDQMFYEYRDGQNILTVMKKK